MEDLVPRVDISSKITDELCNNLRDKNWKVDVIFVQYKIFLTITPFKRFVKKALRS